jgi:ankyrin repeat protein
LNALQHCPSHDLHRGLYKFSETRHDQGFEQILKRIDEAQKDKAHRLLQCVTVAARPLRVEEIAELLAFDFRASSSGGVPKSENWLWDEEALRSTFSYMIAVSPSGDSRVIQLTQLSDFSIKEYLTSPRLARSLCVDASRFHIDLDAAHTIMAQACLETLLRSDEHDGKGDAKQSPLIKYAAQYWVEHAQFDKVSSRVRDGMDDLFDSSKPHFAAWLQVYDIDEEWRQFSMYQEHHSGSPLYYAAFCGFYDLAERLITKHPDQVNARGGRILAPLPAALYKRHFRLANLLHKHGANVVCRGWSKITPLHSASMDDSVDVMRWLLNHGADANTRSDCDWTPLHWAAHYGYIECVQVLLGHNANINLQDSSGKTPLYWVADVEANAHLDKPDNARRLLEHGADPNICDNQNSTPLHKASSRGLLEVARLLLNYGAKVDAKEDGYGCSGWTPFQMAASKKHHRIMELLLEHGAVPPP